MNEKKLKDRLGMTHTLQIVSSVLLNSTAHTVHVHISEDGRTKVTHVPYEDNNKDQY